MGIVELKPLKKILASYLTPSQVDEVEQAFIYAFDAHQGQSRATGEPYITHPVAVATILAEMHMDKETVMAAILHDVIEDTPVNKDNIIALFGNEVAELVDGVSKLTQIEFESKAEAQAENFRKMLLAMARDIRVIIIKLADRLHNMLSLAALNPEKRKRIALETLEIYAPIAKRLGMHDFYLELEDLGFKAYYPLRYRAIKAASAKWMSKRSKMIEVVEKAMYQRLSKMGMADYTIEINTKNYYHIYQSLRHHHLSFPQIMSLLSFRIILPNVDACYRTLGMLHNLYKPLPERFTDYIAIPKANGYQSLHTTLFGPFASPIEIQICTEDMRRLARNGIAAHWIYKSETATYDEAQSRARDWFQKLLDLQQSTASSLEFIENVKIDLFPDEVYVFTPKGAIFELPKGATVVDFAYAIHSDIGSCCIAAKIDHKFVPLSSVLISGQTVEIITAADARPNSAWLSFVVTGKARSNIRHFIKKQQTSESVALGRKLFASALDVPFKKIPGATLNSLLEHYPYASFDELLENIGLGNEIAVLVAQHLQNQLHGVSSLASFRSPKPVAIKGSEGMAVEYAKCCRPIPGDNIIGQLDRGKGLIIHTEQCSVLASMRGNRNTFIAVYWKEKNNAEFKVDLSIEVLNNRGVLAEIAGAVTSADANIDNVSVEERDEKYRHISLTLSVRDRVHLAQVMRRIRKSRYVEKIMRKK